MKERPQLRVVRVDEGASPASGSAAWLGMTVPFTLVMVIVVLIFGWFGVAVLVGVVTVMVALGVALFAVFGPD